MTYAVRTRILYSAAALAMLSMSACLSESHRFPTEPPPPVVVQPIFTSVSVRSDAGFVSNKIRYRDSGLQAARGRVGGGTFEARAMLGANGVALLEVTTGTFADGPSLMRIDKVQIKVVNTDRTPLVAKPQSRTWSTNISGLTGADVLEVTVHVRMSSASGIQVATQLVPVTLPPDVEVVNVIALSQAYVNSPVTITAAVAERNGMWGASANCVLKIDGVAVDQATGIWVDAGDVVSCEFIHMFTSIGTHAVQVSVNNVKPTELNTVNNSAAMSVTIVPQGTLLAFGSAVLLEDDWTERREALRTGEWPIHFLEEERRVHSQLTFDAEDTTEAFLPAQQVGAALLLNGQNVYSSTLTELASYEYVDGTSTVKCSEFQGSSESVRICNTRMSNGKNVSEVRYMFTTGTVTYFASRVHCEVNRCESRTPIVTDDIHRQTGWSERFGLAAGGELTLRLSYANANGETFIFEKSLIAVDHSHEVNYYENFCFPMSDNAGDVCITNMQSGIRLRGRSATN